MKKLLFAVACAGAVLAGCKNQGATGQAAATDSTANRAASSQIVYFDIDSLVNAYDMYLDLKTDYEAKAKKAEGDITSRGRSLEKDIMDFQNKVNKGLITSANAQATQADLEKRQESFMQLRDKLMSEMAEEERVMLNQIHYSIVEYLKEFNADLRYGMIISTSAGGPVMNADPSLDITGLILEGLNQQYAANTPAKK